MIRILLVDDHVLVRLGLREILDGHPDMEVIADASNGVEALEAYGSHRPDVMIMDIQMPEMDGIQATQQLIQQHPDARVLLISIHEGEEDVWRAAQAGVSGYLSKEVDTSALLEAVLTIAGGKKFFPERIAQKLSERESRNNLTPRELETLRLLAKGLSNKEIGSELSVSLATVKLHISNLLEKLGVADRTQAVLAALQRGIIHLHD